MGGIKRDPAIPPYTRCEKCSKLVLTAGCLPFCGEGCKKAAADCEKLRIALRRRRRWS